MLPGVVDDKTHTTQNVKKEKSSLEDTTPTGDLHDFEKAPRFIADENNNLMISATLSDDIDEMNSDNILKKFDLSDACYKSERLVEEELGGM